MASWVWWLAGPGLATVAACLVAWWAGRPKRLPGTGRAVRDHRAYLAGLAAAGGAGAAPGPGGTEG